MNLSNQKKLAAKILKVSPKRVKLNPTRIEEHKEAITKSDIRGLIGNGAIIKKQKKGISRARANKILRQKRKGLRKGVGSKKGTPNSRMSDKLVWMRKIRVQRDFLKELKTKVIIDTITYNLYRKAKGGFFRSKKHIKLYIDEHRLAKK